MAGGSYLPTRTGGATVSTVASIATNATLLAVNTHRLGVTIANTDANDLYIKYGVTATTAAGGWSYKIGSGQTWEMPWQIIYSGQIDGIWSGDGAGYAEITEL